MKPAFTPSLSPLPMGRFWLCCWALYAAVWTLLPPLVTHSFALDVVESLTWGREWQWGYYKHPPLSPWVLHSFYVVFGKFGPYLLSQLCIGLTVWCVWRTGLRLLTPDRALVGAALVMAVVYYTQPALEFNHNIAQMPIWAGLGYLLLAALQDGRWWQWVALGVLAGLGLLTKYSVAVLLLCMGLYVLLTPARAALRTKGPWVAVALMVLVFAPHALWLEHSQWLPFVYASERAAGGGRNPITGALGFAGTQLINHVPLLLIVVLTALAVRWRAKRTAAGAAAQSPSGEVPPHPSHTHVTAHCPRWCPRVPLYLLVIALGPCLLVLVGGLVSGARLRDMWGAPMWAFSGLCVAAWLPQRSWPAMRQGLLRGVVVWMLFITVITMAYATWGAQWRQRAARVDWPAAGVAAQARSAWAQHASCPLQVVAGNYWLMGMTAVSTPDGPSTLLDTDPRYTPWITLERLQREGALWLWDRAQFPGVPDAVPAPMDGLHGNAQMHVFEGSFNVPWHFKPQGAPLSVGWRAYVPAACVRASTPAAGAQ